MILFPNAKINIGLDIIRRRPDGYHDISTVMVPVKWCDVLEIVPAAGYDTILTVSGRTVDCPVEKNLVMRAYRSLAEIVGGLPPVDIFLRKVIPDGAGLGGGSADAAFTLRGLNELFNLGFTAEQLADTASRLGADCPFFIYNRPMLCTETGTAMTEVSLPGLSQYIVAIVKPQVSVPTAKAYAGVTPVVPSTPLEDLMPLFPYTDRIKNDFEKSIFPEYPIIADVKRRLYEDFGAIYASMSGSGSSVYGIFHARSTDADKLAEKLAEDFPDCDTFAGAL